MSRFVAGAYTQAQEDSVEVTESATVPEITVDTMVVPEEEVEAKVELEAGLEALEAAASEAELVGSAIERGDVLVETADAVIAKAESDTEDGEAGIPEGVIVETVVATENLKMILRLPLDDSSVAYESYSTNKLEQLKLATETFKGTLEKAKEHAKKVWEWIVEQFNKIMSYIKTNGYTIDRKKVKVKDMWLEKVTPQDVRVLSDKDKERIINLLGISCGMGVGGHKTITIENIKAVLSKNSTAEYMIDNYEYIGVSGNKILCMGKVFDMTETIKDLKLDIDEHFFRNILGLVMTWNYAELEKYAKAVMKESNDSMTKIKASFGRPETYTEDESNDLVSDLQPAILGVVRNVTGRINFANKVLDAVMIYIRSPKKEK